jgi:hypothetical protein
MASVVAERAVDIPRAIAYLKEALSVIPEDPFLHLSLFRLHGETGDIVSAQRFHDSCAALVSRAKDLRLVQALENGRRRYLQR